MYAARAGAVTTTFLTLAITGAFACSSDYGAADASGVGSSDAGDVVQPASDGGSESAADGGPGCDGCTVVADNQDLPTELLLVAKQLHWVNVGSNASVPRRMNLDTAEVDTAVTYPGGMHDLVFLEGYVWGIDKTLAMNRLFPPYFCPKITDAKRIAAMTASELVWVEPSGLKRGDCASANVSLISGRSNLLAVVGDSPRVYFTDTDGTIQSCDASNAPCTGALVVVAQGAVSVLAVDDTRLYWAAPGSPATIRSIPKLGGTVVDIATDQGDPKVIVPRGGDVYWSDLAKGTVMKGPAAGGAPPIVLASGLDRPWGIAVGGDAVYVAESGAGRITKIPRL